MHATMSTSTSADQTVSINNGDVAPVPSTSWVRGPNLGSGAFAQVYLANDAAGQPMAVKTAVTPAAADSLRHEEAVLSLLRGCPYVVPCLGHDVTHDDFYGEAYNLFLEYAPGGSLSDLIRRRGSRLPEKLVRRLAREILRGLAFVHGQGYVHCDVKPQNILVFQTKSEKGTVTNVKLADFGLAKKVGERPESSLQGTMLYMSPESLSGQCEPPKDVWAVGLVVIEMLTGKPAYHLSAGVDPCTLVFRICFQV